MQNIFFILRLAKEFRSINNIQCTSKKVLMSISKHKLSYLIVIIVLLTLPSSAWTATEKFGIVHREPLQPDRDSVFKKTLYVSGLTNAAYLGINDLVGVLLVAKNETDAKALSAQLLAIKIGLIEKPALIRYIANELEFCEKYPNFPVGFNDSPEGPEKLSAEFYKIADHIENLPINHQLTDVNALRKECEKVLFALFWTDGEKMRTMCGQMLTFIRVELKENLPFAPFTKPRKQ